MVKLVNYYASHSTRRSHLSSITKLHTRHFIPTLSAPYGLMVHDETSECDCYDDDNASGLPCPADVIDASNGYERRTEMTECEYETSLS